MADRTESAGRSSVFVSYAHEDAGYLDELKRHFAPLARIGRLEVWADTRIDPGGRWRQEIGRAIAAADVAILLVSSHFLASDFIAKDELPPLLAAAGSRGVPILSVIVRPCLFRRLPELSEYQAVNDPDRALSEMGEPERDRVWVRTAEFVDTLVGERLEALKANVERDGPSVDSAAVTFGGALNEMVRSIRSAAVQGGMRVKRISGQQRPRLLVTVGGIDHGVYAMPGIPRTHWVQLAANACSALEVERGRAVRAVLALELAPGETVHASAREKNVRLMWKEGEDWENAPWDTSGLDASAAVVLPGDVAHWESKRRQDYLDTVLWPDAVNRALRDYAGYNEPDRPQVVEARAIEKLLEVGRAHGFEDAASAYLAQRPHIDF